MIYSLSIHCQLLSGTIDFCQNSSHIIEGDQPESTRTCLCLCSLSLKPTPLVHISILPCSSYSMCCSHSLASRSYQRDHASHIAFTDCEILSFASWSTPASGCATDGPSALGWCGHVPPDDLPEILAGFPINVS